LETSPFKDLEVGQIFKRDLEISFSEDFGIE